MSTDKEVNVNKEVSTEPETTEVAASAVEKPQAYSSPGDAPEPVKTENKSSSSKGGGVLAGLALLLSMAALGGTGYLWYLQQNAVQQEPAPIDDLRPELAQLTQLSAQLETQIGTLKGELGAAQSQMQTIKQETNAELELLSRDGLAMLSQVTELGRTDRDDWQLAEVEYLLRLAHQRVVMGGELKSAASLLSNADNILHDLNMAGLHQVRRQVARDLAAVRGAVELDSEGIYLRLDALQQQTGSLPFFGMPEIDAAAAEPIVDDQAAAETDDWQSTLDEGWQQAIAKFKTLVVVQKREGSIEPLLSEGWQLLVRERLALALEQAKNAVVLQQQTIYREALSNASDLVQSHYLPDHPATKSALAELEDLQQQKIVMELPDISGSQEAIRAYIDRKYQGQEQAAPLVEKEQLDPPKPKQAEPSVEQEEAP